MIAWHFLKDLHKVCHFQSIERRGEASGSELQRWLKDKAVEVNFEPIGWDEEMPSIIVSFVLFPKNQKRRSTLFYDIDRLKA